LCFCSHPPPLGCGAPVWSTKLAKPGGLPPKKRRRKGRKEKKRGEKGEGKGGREEGGGRKNYSDDHELKLARPISASLRTFSAMLKAAHDDDVAAVLRDTALDR